MNNIIKNFPIISNKERFISMPEPILLYEKMDDPDRAYMIKSGKVKCHLTNEDSYEICCQNAIIGGGEILVSEDQGFKECRHQTVYFLPENENDKNQIIKLNPQQIRDGVNTYKVAFHTARFIAMCLKKINEIRTEKNNQLNQNDEIIKSYCVIYASAILQLQKVFEQKGFPWIEKLVQEGSDSLMYLKGKAFVTMQNRKPIELDSDKLNKYDVKFPKGSFICKQGDEGTELYKVKKGKLKVLVNGNEVTEIEEKTVVGEMALLLGETRTATLMAMEDCIITVISKDNLPTIINDDKNFFKNIIISLSRWELISINLVEQINELMRESKETNDEQNAMKKILEYKTNIKELRKKLNELFTKYEQQFLFEISSDITKGLKEVEKK